MLPAVTTRRYTPAAVVLAIVALLLLLPAPTMPGPGIDNGWVLAAEYAARHGAVFGRDFVFTYGPFAFLSTHLFDPATYGWAVAADLLLIGLWLAPLLVSRRPAVLGAYGLALLLAPYGPDARVAAALFAIVVVALDRPGYWLAAVAAALAPIALSKYSFALAIAPLLLLLDLHYALALRRLPLALAAFLSTLAASLLLAGQPIAAWGPAAHAIGEVIGGYSAAMQLAASTTSLAVMAITIVAILLLVAATAWASAHRRLDARALVRLLSLAWIGFLGFKMGFVRADGHTVITWSLLVLLLPPLTASIDARAPLRRRELRVFLGLALFVALMTIVFAIRFAPIGTAASTTLIQRGSEFVDAPRRTLSYLVPATWHRYAAERLAAERRAARPFPSTVQGSVDVIPHDIVPLIASGLSYRPRPVPQSYSAYTPALQRDDALFFADAHRAPDTLFFAIGNDLDERLPTLAPGPSLPVIAAAYDVAGRDPLGLILRHRAQPRGAVTAAAGVAEIEANAWVALPAHRPDQMVLAAIDLDRTLVAKATGFAAREPLVFIELRFTDGSVKRYRFIPGMAAAGTVLSPMPRSASLADLDAAEGTLFPGTRPAAAGDVAAFRIVADGVARLAYPRGSVTFSTVSLAT